VRDSGEKRRGLPPRKPLKPESSTKRKSPAGQAELFPYPIYIEYQVERITAPTFFE
jgi:hypothetical protein